MFSRLPVLIARYLPSTFKRAIHGNRFLDNAVMFMYGSLLGKSVVPIKSGPMRGLKLATSKNISHAHIEGDYELDVQLAVDRYVRPGDICYDLGASIGYLSLLMAKKAQHVYSFEPAPEAAEEIRRQLAVNPFKNVTIVPTPVSNNVREVRFCITDGAYGAAINENETRWRVLMLETTTLDLFAQTHPLPDFLKIDVEGEEGRVLEGAKTILQRRKTAICCELHSRETARGVVNILTGYGYAISMPDGRPLELPDEVAPGEYHLLALPR